MENMQTPAQADWEAIAREWVAEGEPGSGWPVVKALLAELDRLRAEVDAGKVAFRQLMVERDELRAENTRLEALWDKDTAERDMYGD